MTRTSFPRSQRLSCVRKRRFLLPEDAEEELSRLLREGRDPNPRLLTRTYPCPVCDGYHIGHDRFSSTEFDNSQKF